jgi:hypothetical protein
MALTFIDVLDTAVKIGLGAVISALATYIALIRNHSHEDQKEARGNFYKSQEEKKSKYVNLLSQSQELIQSHLDHACLPDSNDYKKYLRAFNEVQIISNDSVRLAAFNLMSHTKEFIFFNKNLNQAELEKQMIVSAGEKISIFQKVAQIEVTKSYQKT